VKNNSTTRKHCFLASHVSTFSESNVLVLFYLLVVLVTTSVLWEFGATSGHSCVFFASVGVVALMVERSPVCPGGERRCDICSYSKLQRRLEFDNLFYSFRMFSVSFCQSKYQNTVT